MKGQCHIESSEKKMILTGFIARCIRMGISSFICTTYPHTFPTIIGLHRYPMVTHPNVGAGGS